MKRLIAMLGILAAGAIGLAADAPQAADSGDGAWVNISDALIARLEADSLKPTWPGKTAGLTVDPHTGELYLVIPGQGLWKSADRGASFARTDGKLFSGRCETGAALQFDPRGGRLACFFLDGPGGMTLDAGKTWERFADVGRNWDYGAVDWSAQKPVDLFAMRHESGGELYLSNDAGRSWKQVAKDPKYNSVGISPGHSLLTSKSDGGIFRSTDHAVTWSRVADFHVTSHVAIVHEATTYLVAKEGLIASADDGATWTARGEPVDATLGPVFKDAKTLIVWGKTGIQRSTDGGATWSKPIALPPDYGKWSPEWMTNVGWDTNADILYTSHMSMPAYRLQR